ncbi:GntR family transcriptional regulator [Pelagibius litoralis]|uniref:GntR family transcriptional regulator n=1 Tax=Pelagibius litoralis TaxID=374515 RepID=A0A967EZ71_9PROT|nr:GntR family transcriptional regulator [Pelagibius litoralis]NIA70074.1 GntR family transcriptional regulator [Pelagibius litoralis]
MNAETLNIESARRTTADDIFERLRADIVSLQLPPGTKLSEAEVARKFDVSRQPVREAFIRLGNMNLVQIQPQRATIVRRISRSEILEARFIRTAVETEIVRRACKAYTPAQEKAFESNLEQQQAAVLAMDLDRFNTADYAFHRLICVTAGCEFAFKTIAENKVYVDRLCMLSLSSKAGQQEVYDDHVEIFERLRAGDEEGLVAATRLHLSRLNETLDQAQQQYPAYFED